MAVYKESGTNTWRVVYRFTDWTGENKQSSKRGFATKRDALAWEREQLQKAQSDLSMTFGAFVEIYSNDMKTRLRQNTWQTKENEALPLEKKHLSGNASFCNKSKPMWKCPLTALLSFTPRISGPA